MINNVFIWGSKSYSLLVNDIIKNYPKSINSKYINSKKKLKIKFIFDPYSQKNKYKTNKKRSFKKIRIKKYFFNK